MAIRLTLITRRDCHLCEEMAAAIEQVAPDAGAEVEVCDVDADPALRARYSDQVPVLLIDGRKAFKYRVTPSELRARLRRRGPARDVAAVAVAARRRVVYLNR